MRESFWKTLFLVSILVFLGTVGYFTWRYSSTVRAMFPEIGGAVGVTGPQEAAAPQAEEAKEPEKPKSIRDLPQYARYKHLLEKERRPPRVVKPPVEPVRKAPRKPFPVADKLPLGMKATKLRAEFREPAIRITGVERGKMVETYVYRPEGQDMITIARLRDGRLEAAETTVQ